MTWFYYVHETFPKPLRVVIVLFETPVVIASGFSHYLNLGISVYEIPWVAVLSNLIFSAILVYLVVFRSEIGLHNWLCSH